MTHRILLLTLLPLFASAYSLGAAEHQSDDTKVRETLERALETSRAKPFIGLRELRWGAGAEVNANFEDPVWLKPAITVPLKALGISLIEQVGQDVDVNLPVLVVRVYISRTDSGGYNVSLFTTLSRRVLLADLPAVAFHAAIWKKEDSARQPTLADARASAKLMLVQHINELVRYWAMANPPAAGKQRQ